MPAIRHRQPSGADSGGAMHPHPRGAGVRRHGAGPVQSLPQQPAYRADPRAATKADRR